MSVQTEYRTIRQTWPTTSQADAEKLARRLAWVARLEADEEVRFVWEHDPDFDPRGCSDIPALEAEHIEKLASGEWEAWTVKLQVAEVCPHCHQVIEEADGTSKWSDFQKVGDGWACPPMDPAKLYCTPSLSGIVTGSAPSDDLYKRTIECDLVDESGLFTQPAKGHEGVSV